jgi:hypothetical protein
LRWFDGFGCRHARIVVLNLSNNDFVALPKELGDLKVLQELDVSKNRLERLPGAIGNCARLRRLRASGNQIAAIPAEFQQLTLLEELTLSDNAIVEIPLEILRLPKLVSLDLARNDLRRIPVELADAPALEEIDVSGNPKLDSVPPGMHMHCDLIRWLCASRREQERVVSALREANEELEVLCRAYDTERLALREETARLRAENREILDQMPRGYMRMQAACASCCVVM